MWEEARTHADMREHADGPQKGLGPAVNWTQETVARMKQMNRITAANFRHVVGMNRVLDERDFQVCFFIVLLVRLFEKEA